MSSSTYHLFLADPTPGVAEGGRESYGHRNSWGSAPLIWQYVCSTYLDPTRPWMFQLDAFWRRDDPAARDALLVRMSADDRFLLHLTYDRVVVLRRDFRRVAALVRRWADPPSHWVDVADLLEHRADDTGVVAFGFRASSVSEDLWVRYDDAHVPYYLHPLVDLADVGIVVHGELHVQQASDARDLL